MVRMKNKSIKRRLMRDSCTQTLPEDEFHNLPSETCVQTIKLETETTSEAPVCLGVDADDVRQEAVSNNRMHTSRPSPIIRPRKRSLLAISYLFNTKSAKVTDSVFGSDPEFSSEEGKLTVPSINLPGTVCERCTGKSVVCSDCDSDFENECMAFSQSVNASTLGRFTKPKRKDNNPTTGQLPETAVTVQRNLAPVEWSFDSDTSGDFLPPPPMRRKVFVKRRRANNVKKLSTHFVPPAGSKERAPIKCRVNAASNSICKVSTGCLVAPHRATGLCAKVKKLSTHFLPPASSKERAPIACSVNAGSNTVQKASTGRLAAPHRAKEVPAKVKNPVVLKCSGRVSKPKVFWDDLHGDATVVSKRATKSGAKKRKVAILGAKVASIVAEQIQFLEPKLPMKLKRLRQTRTHNEIKRLAENTLKSGGKLKTGVDSVISKKDFQYGKSCSNEQAALPNVDALHVPISLRKKMRRPMGFYEKLCNPSPPQHGDTPVVYRRVKEDEQAAPDSPQEDVRRCCQPRRRHSRRRQTRHRRDGQRRGRRP